MNKTACNVILFAVGAAVGSAVTWKILKTKYERIAQEEIDSVKEEFHRLTRETIDGARDTDDLNVSDTVSEDEEDDSGLFEPDLDSVAYHRLVNKYRSSADVDKSENDEEGGTGDQDEAPYINGPYVITPDEFCSSPPGYSAQALDYFADGVLADGWGVKVDIEDTIGEDSLEELGNIVDDLLYVRNERKEIDYEITKDPRTYREAVMHNSTPDYN